MEDIVAPYTSEKGIVDSTRIGVGRKMWEQNKFPLTDGPKQSYDVWTHAEDGGKEAYQRNIQNEDG